MSALTPQLVTTTDARDFELAAELLEAGRVWKLLSTHPDATPLARERARLRFDSAKAAFSEARAVEAA